MTSSDFKVAINAKPFRGGDTKATAAHYGLSADTLATQRVQGQGFPFLKLAAGRSGKVLYDWDMCDAWLRSRVVHSTSETPPQAA